MSKTRESSLWGWLAGARPVLGKRLQMTRMENMLGAGVPDVEAFLDREQFWLELKTASAPMRSATPLRFALAGREAQIEFMRHRWSLGGTALWLLQVGSGTERKLYLAPGDMGDYLRDGIVESVLAVRCVATGFFAKRCAPSEVLERARLCRENRNRKCTPN